MRQLGVRSALARSTAEAEFHTVVTIATRLSLIVTGVILTVAALDLGQFVLAPVFLAIVIGLMFGPVADRIERFGIPPWISAGAVLLLFILLIAMAMTAFVLPLSSWIDRVPEIWERLQLELRSWKGIVASIAGVGEQLREALGQSTGVRVAVEDDSAVENVAFLAPAIVAQILVFLASMYFFIATRHGIRLAILKPCYDRRLRWRVAHVFRDVEQLVSRYLLSITLVNIGLGVAVALGLWIAGVPSPHLWGLLAFVLNYIIYIGPAVMALVLFGVGLATADGTWGIFVPPAIFLACNAVEAQFATPHVLGRTMTLNPFLVLLALVFWIWIWGPVGGFIAVPALLICNAVFTNIFPLRPAVPQHRLRASSAAPKSP